MASKLFVGGIPWRATEDELRNAFAQAGEVASVSILMERDNPSKSRGFGFVEMATEEGAQNAISMWNGKEFGGRMLKVDYQRPKAE